jgi:catechol 2,3-dioxygenase-like lactoylglutathione lyase family enzyme
VPLVAVMKQSIAHVALLVRDYDEAIAFYTQRLGFHLIEDMPRGPGKRWVVVAPPGAAECTILLAKAQKKEELDAVGHQSGSRVFLFLRTDDFERDYRAFLARGVHFEETPRRESYGTVAIFNDLYGNRWDLLQLNGSR